MDIKQNVILAPFTTFHIGGPADYFVRVTTQEELLEAIHWANTPEVKRPNTSGVGPLPFFVLGKGANILVGDKGYRGLVIKNETNKFQISNAKYPMSNDTHNPLPLTHDQKDFVFLTAESGADVQEIIAYTAKIGLSGFEHFAGIPSTIGGALWQNLHFLSPDRSRTVYISEILEGAQVQKSSGSSTPEVKGPNTSGVSIVDKEYFHFSYDYSSLHDKPDIVVSACFRLTPKSKEEIEKTIAANIAWRMEKHPENATTCSAGSVFKKIEGYGAGRLIEKVGLKGHKIGGAKISEKHANFIINTGTATAADVRALIDLAQRKVKQELGLELLPEISFVGEF